METLSDLQFQAITNGVEISTPRNITKNSSTKINIDETIARSLRQFGKKIQHKEIDALADYNNSQAPTEIEMNLMAAYYGENK